MLVRRGLVFALAPWSVGIARAEDDRWAGLAADAWPAPWVASPTTAAMLSATPSLVLVLIVLTLSSCGLSAVAEAYVAQAGFA